MQKSKKQIRKKSVNNSFSISLIKGILSGIAGYVIFLALFSVVILKSNISNDNYFIMVLISSCVSSVVAAVVSSISIQKSKLVTGMLSTIIVTIIQFIILLCFNNIDLSVKVYLMFPINIVIGFLGSIIGTNIKR